jgi:hypothetical protein
MVQFSVRIGNTQRINSKANASALLDLQAECKGNLLSKGLGHKKIEFKYYFAKKGFICKNDIIMVFEFSNALQIRCPSLPFSTM